VTWQVASELWNQVRRAVDAADQPGQFLLTGSAVDDAATNLERFAEQIDSQRSGSPAFLAVICGKGYGYRRAVGVFMIPVGISAGAILSNQLLGGGFKTMHRLLNGQGLLAQAAVAGSGLHHHCSPSR
jgi:hypothetical protein